MDVTQPHDASNLALPHIPEAHAGSLVARTGRSVRVVIEPWPGMAHGDIVWLHWRGSQHGGSLVRLQTVKAGHCGKPTVFLVDDRYVRANTYGSIQVSYLIDRPQKPTLISDHEIYSVAGLQPPSVDGVRLLRYDLPPMLPYVTPGTGAIVRVPPWPGMAVDDQLIVSWQGQQPGSHFVERVAIDINDLSREVPVHVPETFIQRSLSRAQMIEVHYLIAPASGEEAASPSCRPFLIGGLP